MSLNASQMDATRRELQANFERSGLSAEAVAARLGVGATRGGLVRFGTARQRGTCGRGGRDKDCAFKKCASGNCHDSSKFAD